MVLDEVVVVVEDVTLVKYVAEDNKETWEKKSRHAGLPITKNAVLMRGMPEDPEYRLHENECRKERRKVECKKEKKQKLRKILGLSIPSSYSNEVEGNIGIVRKAY